MNNLDHLYKGIRDEGGKLLVALWVFCLFLSISGAAFKDGLVPDRVLPPSNSPDFKLVLWFITGIEGLFTAVMITTNSVIYAGIGSFISKVFGDEPVILVFYRLMIPLIGLLLVLRTIMVVEIFQKLIEIGDIGNFSPALLNEVFVWLYSGVAIMIVFFCAYLEFRYLKIKQRFLMWFVFS